MPWCSTLSYRFSVPLRKLWRPTRAVMHDSESPASARVSAAKTILDTAIKAVELEDLEQRLTALEMQQGMTR